MFLSLIVPVYNTEKYLADCLQSLFEQDLPYSEYEVICVNDGSTDNSLKILNDYQKRYPNIVIVNKENQGVSVARNVGIAIAKGDYIWFVDSDDFIQTEILGELKQIAEKNNYDRIVTGFYCFNDYLNEDELIKKRQRTLVVNSNQYDSVITTSLFRRDYINKNHLKFNYPNVADGEDTIFMYEFKLYMPTKVELNRPYYFYRHRENSAMTGKTRKAMKRKQMSYLYNVKTMKRYFDKESGDNTDTANVLMNFLWLELFFLAHMPLKESLKYLHELKKDGLYPFSRPEACTLVKSYLTTRTDIVGKMFDKIYLNMNTRPWFWIMKLWVLLEKLKNNITGKN